MTKKNTKAQSGQDNKLFDDLINKAELKQLVYKNTLETFKLFKNTTTDMVADYQRYCETKKIDHPQM